MLINKLFLRPFFSLFIICFLAACKEEPIFYPKPRLFPKVEFPTGKVISFQKDYCPFTFEYSDFMKYEQDTVFLTKGAANPCWFNLSYDGFNSDIHFTYTDISAKNPEERAQKVYKVYRDAYKLSDEHDRKANLNEDLIINIPERNVYGVLYNIEGDVASSFQFILTDSVQHAIRASLYFRSVPKQDSMAPIVDFMKTDIMNMINSFHWK